MSESSYIKMVPQSTKMKLSIDEVKDLFNYYKQITSKTGEQLNWEYAEMAFPYQIKQTEAGNDSWFYLYSEDQRYHIMAIGVEDVISQDETGEESVKSTIQITLPESSTYGDKGKANEFAKFLAKKLQAELHLFNGRVMYFYPRK